MQETSPILQTQGLQYSFGGGRRQLSGLDLQIPEGAIYGFLGPNGAGKTTTLCLLTGLYRLQEGSVQIFGYPLQHHRLQIALRTGVLIESPSLYGHLSAKDNLMLYRQIYGVSLERVNELLALTGLAETGTKKVRYFSLGMKQRLAIALALLPEPRLLILDEPTNGLDPEGMQQLRELLQLLNRKYGITILLSSHLLSEVEKLCTHIGILVAGQLRYQGSLQDFRNVVRSGAMLYLETSDNSRALGLLQQFKPVRDGDGLLIQQVSTEKIYEINDTLVANNIRIGCLYPRKSDLEQLYLQFTNHTA